MSSNTLFAVWNLQTKQVSRHKLGETASKQRKHQKCCPRPYSHCCPTRPTGQTLWKKKVEKGWNAANDVSMSETSSKTATYRAKLKTTENKIEPLAKASAKPKCKIKWKRFDQSFFSGVVIEQTLQRLCCTCRAR
jgi:hypothetical protein